MALALLVVGFGARAPDPAVELAAREIAVTRVTELLDALDALEASIEPGLDAGRRGAARVVAGADPPGAQLEEAATLLAEAEDDAIAVRRAAAALDGALRALGPDAPGFAPPLERGELGSIASQLEASAEPADAFAAMRRRAERVAGTLEDALAALDEGNLDDAAQLVSSARSDHDALSDWENELLTLPIWIETTDAMIGDLEAIVSATRSGDAAGATAAAEAFAARAEDAATADRALRIAMGEGGVAVTAAPLGRLAASLAAIERARADASAIRSALDR